MSAKESNSPPPNGLGFAVWSDNEARVRRLLAEGASADDYGDGVVDKTPLMESVDEIEDFYDDNWADAVAGEDVDGDPFADLRPDRVAGDRRRPVGSGRVGDGVVRRYAPVSAILWPIRIPEQRMRRS